jgi:hypothetical protein
MSDFEKNLKKSIGKFPATGMKKAGPDLSTPSDFLSRRKVLGGSKAILSGVLSKTPVGKAAKVVGSVLGVGAAAKGVSDLKDDESFEEGREEGKKEGSDFKAKAKKEIGKKLGQVEGVINKSKGGSVIARGNKLARSKPTRLF